MADFPDWLTTRARETGRLGVVTLLPPPAPALYLLVGTGDKPYELVVDAETHLVHVVLTRARASALLTQLAGALSGRVTPESVLTDTVPVESDAPDGGPSNVSCP